MVTTKSGRTILETNEKVKAEGIPSNTLIGLLQAAGYSHVVMKYDGQGDSGQVEEVIGYKNGDIAALDEVFIKKLDILAYDILEHYCPGDWVNNEGGFGQITVHLSGDADVELEFSQRVRTTEDEGVLIPFEAVEEMAERM